MKTANRLDGIGEYYFSSKLREIAQLNQEGRDIINLGIGSPDLPPHPDVIRVLAEESARPDTHGYQGYKGAPALRNAFSAWYKKWYSVILDPESEILPLIGSKEGIMHLCMTYLQKNDEALVPDPGYPTYSSAVKLAGADSITYELTATNHWQPNFERLQDQVSEKTKLFFVNYPQMPTGQRADMGLFERIIKFARKNDLLVVHDNPYSFILNQKPMSILQVDGAKDVAVELNSLSKSHNMAGWRIGVLCGSAQRINEVMRFKSNMDSGMFLPMQLAAAKALELGREWHDEQNKIYSSRRELALKLLKEAGCSVSDGQEGLFLWAAVPGRYIDGYALSDDILYHAGVFITPGGIFGEAGKQYVRISLCSKSEKLEEAITRIQTRLK